MLRPNGAWPSCVPLWVYQYRVGRAWVHAPFLSPNLNKGRRGIHGNSSDRQETTQLEGTRKANIAPLKRISPYFAFMCSGLLLGVLISIDHPSAGILFRIGLGFAALIVGAIVSCSLARSRSKGINCPGLKARRIDSFG